MRSGDDGVEPDVKATPGVSSLGTSEKGKKRSLSVSQCSEEKGRSRKANVKYQLPFSETYSSEGDGDRSDGERSRRRGGDYRDYDSQSSDFHTPTGELVLKSKVEEGKARRFKEEPKEEDCRRDRARAEERRSGARRLADASGDARKGRVQGGRTSGEEAHHDTHDYDTGLPKRERGPQDWRVRARSMARDKRGNSNKSRRKGVRRTVKSLSQRYRESPWRRR